MAGRAHIYEQVRDIVRDIPYGQVASYGQIASLVRGCTARMVGHAMKTLPEGSDVPWHRVINSRGKISQRTTGDGDLLQRQLLEDEGVRFEASGRVPLGEFAWER